MLATLPSHTRMPPNKRLKLTGPALKGNRSFVRRRAHGASRASLRPSAFAPQLKRDPLDGGWETLMSMAAILYIGVISLGLGLLIRRVMTAQSRSPENDSTVRRGDDSP